MRSRRAPTVSAPPLNCGVMRRRNPQRSFQHGVSRTESVPLPIVAIGLTVLGASFIAIGVYVFRLYITALREDVANTMKRDVFTSVFFGPGLLRVTLALAIGLLG